MKLKSQFFNSGIISLLTILSVSFPCNGQTILRDTTAASFRIIRAVETGDTLTFKSLLASDHSLVNAREPVMDDPLLVLAARKNQPGMVSLLLKSGADIHATNRLGSNALHLAAFTGDYALMELLFNSGVDWKVRNLRGKIPLDYVSFGKNPKVFGLFLEKDKNCLNDRTTDGSTLLHLAAITGDTAGFDYLLRQGLDITVKDNNGANVVFIAMESGDMTMLKFLRGHGADIDAAENNGFTPLFWAVLRQSREMTLFLLGNGADVNHRTKDGYTPLLIASGRDSLFMVELLAGRGADLQATDSEGRTALHIAVRGDNQPISSWLATGRVPVNSRDKYGMTPLHYASIYGYAGIGKVLLEKGADPSITDDRQHNAGYYCEFYGNRELSQYLLQKEVKKAAGRDQAEPLTKDLTGGQAVIHYLNHSGYAIETAKHLLVFDYFRNNPASANPSLLNGIINPAELKGKKVVVLVSHEHTDHYDTTIWSWRNGIPGITYVMGFDPGNGQQFELMEPRRDQTIGGLSIHTIRSTDSGVGFLVEADGITVYHPGDHVNKSPELAADFKDEIDFLAGLKKKVDIAFFPVSGCGFPDREAVKTGNNYVIASLKPGICFAMHGETTGCAGYAEDIERSCPGQKTGYGTFPGDRFVYKSN